jgi:ferrous iron transport protein B
MGQALEPAVAPLGWDWRIAVSVLASFPAREVVIATLGTIFNLGEGAEAGSEALRERIQTVTRSGTGARVFTLPVGLSLMVFFALCAQCSSTLVVMGRELGSVVWPIVVFVGMTTIAYLAAWATATLATAAGL